jgi:hypothetical protein
MHTSPGNSFAPHQHLRLQGYKCTYTIATKKGRIAPTLRGPFQASATTSKDAEPRKPPPAAAPISSAAAAAAAATTLPFFVGALVGAVVGAFDGSFVEGDFVGGGVTTLRQVPPTCKPKGSTCASWTT